MANTILDNYKYYFYKLTDERVKDWPFMWSPMPLLTVLIAYLFIIYKIGPYYMQNRKAYDLKNVIALYNLFQVIANATIFYYTLTSGWLTTYSWGCQPVDYSFDPEPMRMAKVVWWLFMLKVVDLFETFFFVLRKKKNQISGLHVYHHTSTILLCWIGAKYTAGGMATFSMLINSFIHILMYTYYLLSIGGPKIQQKLQKWKQRLTIAQMVQFCIIFIHSLQIFSPACPIPKFYATLFIPNVVLVFYLFYGFYNNAYNHVKKE